MKSKSLLVCAALPALAIPCCIAYRSGEPVHLSGENAVIVWDSKSKMEHFVRQAEFDAKGKPFGFIVPTYSVPEMAVASTEVFSYVDSIIEFDNAAKFGAKGGVNSKAAGGIEIVKTQKVGDYQATVIKATDGGSMAAWLKANGFATRPAMTEWLDHYAKQGWMLTALRYQGDPSSKTKTKAVRFSFKSDVPRFPYKMPSDTWPEGHVRNLKLTVISDSKLSGMLVPENRAWEAKEVWSGPIKSYATGKIAGFIGLRAEQAPEEAVMTQYILDSNRNGFENDLVFVKPPSILGSLDPTANAMPALALGGLGAATAVFLVGRRLRRV